MLQRWSSHPSFSGRGVKSFSSSLDREAVFILYPNTAGDLQGKSSPAAPKFTPREGIWESKRGSVGLSRQVIRSQGRSGWRASERQLPLPGTARPFRSLQSAGGAPRWPVRCSLLPSRPFGEARRTEEKWGIRLGHFTQPAGDYLPPLNRSGISLALKIIKITSPLQKRGNQRRHVQGIFGSRI